MSTVDPDDGPDDSLDDSPDDSLDAAAPQADPVRTLGVVERVKRALAYALLDGGERLWDRRWIERTCRPLLEALLSEGGMSEEMTFRIHAASEHLEGIDAAPWFERKAPLEAAQEHLLALDLPPESLLFESLIPRGGLIEVEDVPEEKPEPRSRGRKTRGKKTRGRKQRQSAPPPEAKPKAAPPPPPPPPSFALGHPDHTGRSIGELTVDGRAAPQPLLDALAARGTCTIAELISLPPVEHERLTPLDSAEPLPEGGEVAVVGEVRARWTRLSPTGRVEEVFLASDDRVYRCRWSGELPGSLARVRPGTSLVLVGELLLTDDGPVIYEPIPWRRDSRGVVRRPIYGVKGVNQDALRRLIRGALEAFAGVVTDPLPQRVIRDGRVFAIDKALRALHIPDAGFSRSRDRFVFEELFLHQLNCASRKPTRLRGNAVKLSHEAVGQLQILHGVVLDDSQEEAFNEIRRDLRRPQAMNRLLQGDVGAGKSLVALLAAVMVASDRAQVLFLAPDALAADHRFLFAEPLLRSVGIMPQLLTKPATAGQLDAIKRGNAQLIFATHAIVEQGLPEFKKLGLVIVEERDAFGVIDREKLIQRSTYPDLLLTTSVPIPSSLVFTVFQDYTLSVIDLPTVQHVETRVGDQDAREPIYERVREQLANGRQGYVVFPLIEGRDLISLEKARQLSRSLATEAFPGARVAIYHGSMSREDRIRVFEDFQQRRIDLLLATTTIEDAPEVSNATALVIEYADRFDLVRLHRLRGYVSKGSFPGYCGLLMSDAPKADARERIDLVAREQDGFAIAEQDRLARGDDALLGELAGDVPAFEWADAARDRELLLRARRVAFSVLGQDPQLRQQTHRGIAELIGAPVTPAARRSRRRGRRRRR